MQNVTRCVVFVILGCGLALAQGRYKPLYKFGTNPEDGLHPTATLISDSVGNLYGTTTRGGTSNDGTIFELSQKSDGSWVETTLYNFCIGCVNGTEPSGPLLLDSAGNLYGTTHYGGVNTCNEVQGCGVVFELSRPIAPGGAWTYAVLYSFCSIAPDCQDGAVPNAPLVFDKAGNLYGTTQSGGENAGQLVQGGTVFELSPTASGWTETVLYNFCSIQQNNYCLDSEGPGWGVTFDKSGNLYGTTDMGGIAADFTGTLYKLSPGSDGWTETVLRRYSAPQEFPLTLLGPGSFDPEGNLYTTFAGIAPEGGGYSKGGVVRMSTDGVFHSFEFDGVDGRGPLSGVIVDSQRHFVFGTTVNGGPGRGAERDGFGNVFELNSSGQEKWGTLCTTFPCQSGELLVGGLLEDKSGNLYGTAEYGGLVTGTCGSLGCGLVFEITPDGVR